MKAGKFVDATTAIREIKRGKRILIGSGCAEPQYLTKQLVENHQRFYDNEIVHLLTTGFAGYASPEYNKAFRHNAFFIGANVRKSVAEGISDYTPVFLSEIPLLFKNKKMGLHCAIVEVSPPDSEGYVSLGVSVDIVLSAIMNAELVIAQVNKNMPRTLGKAILHVSDFDYLVEHDEPILELHDEPLDPVSMAIGKNIASCIKDGDTLQLGIGKIPNAVLKNLSNKKDLGIHTEMFSNGVADLYKNGNITNKKKGFHDGKTITSFIMGNKELYDIVNNNPDFEFYPSDYVNDPFNIAKNKNMVSINSALEVDLTGQVCADSIGCNFYSGIGGQVDFVRGAKRSEGGRSFIALPSTAKGGKLSRIVANLSEGAGVVTSRGDVEYVVTEYGVAYLHGKTIRERAMALIQIAHPDFRAQLLESIKERNYVRMDQEVAAKSPDLTYHIPEKENFKDKTINFRVLRPSDESLLQDFLYSLNPDSIYHAYLSYTKTFPHEEMRSYLNPDYENDIVIGGFEDLNPYAKMDCIAKYLKKSEDTVEVNFIIGQEYRGLGLASFLMQTLVDIAKTNKVKKVLASTDYSNIPMMKILEKSGFVKDNTFQDPEVMKFELTLEHQE